MNISIKNAAVTIDGKSILEYVNFDVKAQDHIAIVGRNGAGKTTLLKALIDNDMFEEGIGEEKFSITKLGKYEIGYLKQIDFEDESISLLDEIRKSFQNLINMENKIESLVLKMNENNDEKLIKEYTDLLERFNLNGGYTYQKEVESMLKKFGFTETDKNRPISSFSGGQKTKIAFIKLLLSKPDLLLLDEPTNHLDIDTITWLEDYLKKYKKSLIIVSHDRMFINNICNVIYDIEYGKTVRYVGNYEHYEKQKKLNLEKALEDYEYQQKEIKKLKSIYERFRYKPSKASLAMSRLHRLEKMVILEKHAKADTKVFKTNLENIKRSGEIVLNLKDLNIGYNKTLATLNLNINRQMKIGVIGKNGIGKSTLLKTVEGSVKPLGGHISYGANIEKGYFDQNLAMIDSNQTVLEEFRKYLPDIPKEECRRALGSFLFKEDDVFKIVNSLSGGEKVRLELCKIFYSKPNFLILDEPTNHLDIIGKNHLEDILSVYKGTIIFVSHDRYFVKKIATELLVFEDDGVKFYPFGYDEYLRRKNGEKEVKCEPRKEQKEKKKVNTYNINKEIKKIETEIAKLESELKKLTEETFANENYTNYEKMVEINKRQESIQKKLEEKNNTWEELYLKIEGE